MLGDLFARFADVAWTRRRALTVLVLAVVAFAGAGLPRLYADFGSRPFVAGQGDGLAFLDEHQARWGDDEDVVVVTVDAGGASVLDRLDAIARIEGDLRDLDGVDGVVSLLDVPQPVRGPLGTVQSIPAAAAKPERLLSDEALVPGLLDADGTGAALLVDLSANPERPADSRPAVEAIRAVAAAHQGDEGLTFGVGGLPAVRVGLMEVIVSDHLRFWPIVGVVVLAVLAWAGRSVHGVVIPVIAALLPLILLLGGMGWLGVPLGHINQACIVLMPVLAVAEAVHLMHRYHEEARRFGPGRQAVIETWRHAAPAAVATTGTTLVGFVSLQTASMPLVRDFGLVAAAGVLASFSILVALGVPLFAAVSAVPVQQSPGIGSRAFTAVADLAIARPYAALAGSIVVGLALIRLAAGVPVDHRLGDTLPDGHPASAATEVVDQELGGALSLEIALEGPPGAFARPEVLASLRELELEAEARPEVRFAASPATLLHRAAERLGGTVPTSPGAIEAIYERAGKATIGLVDGDRAHARLVIRTVDPGARAFDALAADLERRAALELAPHGISARATGLPVLAYRGIHGVAADLRDSLLSELVVIALIVAFQFRSLRIGLVSLAPNLVPLLAGWAVMGVAGWKMTPAQTVVFAVALGLAVDDTIHLLHRWREERARGAAPEEAIRVAVRSSGGAVLVTGALLVVAFGVHGVSDFPTTRIFGVVGAVVVSASLVCEAVLLPALLSAFGARLSPIVDTTVSPVVDTAQAAK
jgi:hydrophobe/amphiphile efflux-3 (HAE3) family protein